MFVRAKLEHIQKDIELCMMVVLCSCLRFYYTWIQERVTGAWIKRLRPVREGFVFAMHEGACKQEVQYRGPEADGLDVLFA